MTDDLADIDYCWWCPDCELPRDVCTCHLDDFHSLECTCEHCIQSHPERSVYLPDDETDA